MTERYSILQKKLQELESDLERAFSLDLLEHNRISQDIDQRFDFLKTLLSAEITSSPQKPHHLQHIGNRLSELETKFRKWYFIETATHDLHLENVSTCSCTESCLNDDGDATFEVGSISFEEKGNGVEGFAEENSTKEEKVKVAEIISESKKEETRAVGGVDGWRICASFGVGVVVGMALTCFVMVNLFDRFSYGERRTSHAAPT